MTSNSPSDVCECGHDINSHSLYRGIRSSCYLCECLHFTPQPQDVSNSQQGLQNKSPHNLDLGFPTDTISSLIEKTKKGCGEPFDEVIPCGAINPFNDERELCDKCQSRLQALNECAEMIRDWGNEYGLSNLEMFKEILGEKKE